MNQCILTPPPSLLSLRLGLLFVAPDTEGMVSKEHLQNMHNSQSCLSGKTTELCTVADNQVKLLPCCINAMTFNPSWYDFVVCNNISNTPGISGESNSEKTTTHTQKGGSLRGVNKILVAGADFVFYFWLLIASDK